MKYLRIISVFVMLLLISACAKDRLAERRARYKNLSERQRFTKEHNLQNLPPFDVPIELNDRVMAWMDYFQGPGRKHYQRYLERSGRYIDLMQDILAENGMPLDLVYVAMIESGFNNNAYSRAHAVGPWQFIRGTGSRYGLEISRYVDERRDPVKATWSAAKYLKDLYDEFGDWYLAMAAYNAGEGRIRKAIAQSGSKNFWVISSANEKYLRPETRDYVPKFIAAAIIAKMPHNFGFENVSYQDPLDYEVSVVETQTDFEAIAECAGVSVDVISDLNPHLTRNTTPPGARDYTIHLPKGAVDKFRVKYAAMPESERVKIAYHKVRRGETVATIAKRYGISRSALIAANDISSKRRLKAGTLLQIPKGSFASSSDDGDYGDDKGGQTQTASRTKKLITYRVRKGDTLSRIAIRHGVTISQLKSWNVISKNNALQAGRRLKIYQQVAVAKRQKEQDESRQVVAERSAGTSYHNVKSGDTLWSISQKYGLKLKELVEINGFDSSAKIKPGQKILISGQSQDVASSTEKRMTKANLNQSEDVNMTIAMASQSQASPDDISFQSTNMSSHTNSTLMQQNEMRTSKRREVAESRSSSVTKSYKVKKGDSLGTVAQRYGVSVKELMQWNGIKNPRTLRAGQTLKIASAASGVKQGARSKKQEVRGREQEAVEQTSVVQNTSSANSELTASTPEQELQNIEKTTDAPIKLSQMAPDAAQSTMSYRVINGDTLWDIARRHGVSISQIQQWNNLADPSAVKPGDTITIHK